MHRVNFRAMGCHMLAAMESESPKAAEVLAEVPQWFEEWEAVLSRFRPDSELAALNNSDGGPVQVGNVLWDVLQESLTAARRSDGLVVPTLLRALEAAGYDQPFDDIRHLSRELPYSSAEAFPTDWRSITFNSRARTVTLPTGMRLDLGGIAKGWAADRALKRLSPFGPALVDAGGDIAAGEAPAVYGGWPVGITHPLHPGESLGTLRLSHNAVATSGRDYRRWRSGNTEQHHILDPRTGQPARTDVVSATVVAPTAREAEAAAKAVFILGAGRGLEWINSRMHLAALLVLENDTVVRSHRFHDYVWRTQ